MVLLRRVIGDALRARRQGQHRTLREVSTAANVSLGYLSEIERGQKEASSELLSSICDALGAQLSELLREVSDTLQLAEQVDGVPAAVPVPARAPITETTPDTPVPVPAGAPATAPVPVPAGEPAARAALAAHVEPPIRRVTTDGKVSVATDGRVSVSVHQDSPLKATLRATKASSGPREQRERDVVFAA